MLKKTFIFLQKYYSQKHSEITTNNEFPTEKLVIYCEYHNIYLHNSTFACI